MTLETATRYKLSAQTHLNSLSKFRMTLLLIISDFWKSDVFFFEQLALSSKKIHSALFK